DAGRSDEATSRLGSATGGRGGVGGAIGQAAAALVSGSLGISQGGPASYGISADATARRGGHGGQHSAASPHAQDDSGGTGGVGGMAGGGSVVIGTGSIDVSAPSGGIARAASEGGNGGAGGAAGAVYGSSNGGTGGAGGSAGPASMSVGDGVVLQAG